jgi:hypothetical protein
VTIDVYPKNITSAGEKSTGCCLFVFMLFNVRLAYFDVMTYHTLAAERAIQHEDFSQGASSQYRFTRIRVVFPEGFDVCDAVIGIQGNISGITIRKFGSNVTRALRMYKASSTVSTTRGITEPSISVQKTQRPIPMRGPASPNACVCNNSLLT